MKMNLKLKKHKRGMAVLAVALIIVATAAIFLQTQDRSMGALFTVTYADGSTEIVDSNGFLASLNFGEMRLTNTGGATINNIKIECYITPTWDAGISYLQSYTVSGSFRMQIKDLTTNSVVYDSYAMAISPISPLPTLTSGYTKVITSATIAGNSLQSLYGGWVNGRTYQLIYSNPGPITVTLNFADGSHASRSTTVSTATWNFKYSST